MVKRTVIVSCFPFIMGLRARMAPPMVKEQRTFFHHGRARVCIALPPWVGDVCTGNPHGEEISNIVAKSSLGITQ